MSNEDPTFEDDYDETEAMESEAMEDDDTDGPEEEEGPDEIEQAFLDGMDDEKSEDDIMLDMISAGATFKTVKSLYNKYMVEGGYINSRAEKSEIVNETLEGMDLSTEEGFDAAVEKLVESLKGVNAKSAAGSVRQYAKKNELECYKKPKGAGGTRSGITDKFYSFLKEAIPAGNVTKEVVAKWIDENGTENTKRHSTHYHGIAKLCQEIRDAK